MSRRNLILDCDPGIDDSLAMGLAIANQDKFNIIGITTVGGNQNIQAVTSNALSLISFLHEDIPVASGAGEPLIRDTDSAEEIHGKTGLGNCILPETNRQPMSDNAVQFLQQVITKLPDSEKVTLVATGPLTNIALLLKTFPEVKEKIDVICLMGGSATGGNKTATAEFNVWCDPEAAQIVFKSKLPVIMCGLDVTLSSGIYREQVKELLESKSPVLKAYGEMFDYYFQAPIYQYHNLLGIHDATTIMYLLYPEIFYGEDMNVTVDCGESLNRGMTICDRRYWFKENAAATKVILRSDQSKYNELLMKEIYRLGKRRSDEEI